MPKQDDAFISYASFDKLYDEVQTLTRELMEIHCEPINEGLKIMRDVSEIIAASDNVVRFLR
jgi:hypothetical protein